MCWVMPPASRAVTLVARMASSRLVLPWSTCPRTVTTGGRDRSFAGSVSSHRTCFVDAASGATSSSTTGVGASSSARVSKPSSFATSVAVSKSTVWLIDAITPMFTRPRITSTTLTSSARASSPTAMVLGSVTTDAAGSATATAGGAWTGIGCGCGCGRCGRRPPLGRGPRCGGIRRGLALGIPPPLLRGRGELRSQRLRRGLVYRYFKRPRKCAPCDAPFQAALVGIEVGPPAGSLAAQVDGETARR